MMAHAQKPDFAFRRNGRVHLKRRGRQFSRLLTAEVCASAVVMLDTPCSEVVRSVLATHSIRQFPLHFPTHASPCAITFQLGSTTTAQNLVWRTKTMLRAVVANKTSAQKQMQEYIIHVPWCNTNLSLCPEIAIFHSLCILQSNFIRAITT